MSKKEADSARPGPQAASSNCPSKPTRDTAEDQKSEVKNGESLPALRKMISGHMEYSDKQQLPGKYLALDCEMVGVGIDGSESSLARVSLINYYGAVQVDEFVRQRERVVDYRTQFSGVREKDMIKAKPFNEVQKQVAELLKDRILIGHAVFNDLKALLLSHPRPQTRDTQHYAKKFNITRSRYIALRNLVKQELDVTIQSGEHSSVTDARATMAVYRVHRKEWEKGNKTLVPDVKVTKKRKRSPIDVGSRSDGGDGEDGDEWIGRSSSSKFVGGGRKGVSSGLSTVIRRGGRSGREKTKWWKELGGGTSKGMMNLSSKPG